MSRWAVAACFLWLGGCGGGASDDGGAAKGDARDVAVAFGEPDVPPADVTAIPEVSAADVLEPEDLPPPIEDLPTPPPDPGAPEDLPPPPPKDTVTGFDNGQVDPGGFLSGDAAQSCEALDLPTKWSGTFEGDIKSNWGNTGVDGTMTYEIGCLAGKYVVWGDMTGQGQGQPFTLTIKGSFNPATGEMKCKMEGSVALFWVLPVAFTGDFNGSYDGTQFSGTWAGENTDKTVLQATGEGTWVATGQ